MKYLKLFLEYSPLVLFLLVYKFYGIIPASYSIIITSLLSFFVSFLIDRKISYVQLFTSILLIIMGGLTIYSGDSKFIKMKPTIINLLFFAILMGGAIAKKGLLKYILGKNLSLSDSEWIIFSKRWASFFLVCAILNEIIWRNFSENIWVNFKVFGLLTLTIIFLAAQYRFLQAAQNKTDNK